MCQIRDCMWCRELIIYDLCGIFAAGCVGGKTFRKVPYWCHLRGVLKLAFFFLPIWPPREWLFFCRRSAINCMNPHWLEGLSWDSIFKHVMIGSMSSWWFSEIPRRFHTVFPGFSDPSYKNQMALLCHHRRPSRWSWSSWIVCPAKNLYLGIPQISYLANIYGVAYEILISS